MPISLNTFQNTLSTTNLDGFIKLSGDGSSVKSYGDGFFARHFGLYTKPSVEENNAVRRAFYESVTSSIDCRGAVLDALRKDLGIGDDGSCTSGKQLSVREAKSILSRVKSATISQPDGTGSASPPKIAPNGKHFDVNLGSAVQKSIVSRLGASLARADKPDEYPDIDKSFLDALKDYARTGFGLKIGNSFVARINEHRKTSADAEEMKAKIGRFFAEDTVNGARASRIIGDIVHQGFFSDLMLSMQETGEPFDFSFGANQAVVAGFFLDRADDGSYQIKLDGIFRHSMAFGNDGNIIPLDASQSKIHIDVRLTLSFDGESGKPNLTFTKPPTISGTVTKIDCPMSSVTNVTSPLTTRISLGVPTRALELSGELAKPEFRKAVTEAARKDDVAALSKLVSERLVTEDDIELLVNLGIDNMMIEEMIAGTAGDEKTPRLDKETMNRLRDPATRDAAVRDIKAMAQMIVDAGWADKMPDIHAEALNLVTVAGISPVSASREQSDVKLVMDFIDKSDDQNVRNILADLQSGDPGTVAAAKTRAQDIVHTQRQGLGLALLKSHIRGISDSQIELLQKHIPAAQYTEALQHIVDRDSFMDGAVSYFESMIKTAETMEAEAQKLAKYNSYVKVDLFADQANVARATAKGYTPAELGKINRAANLFMAITPGVTQEQALVEVMTPGYKANRLMEYGGRFMDDPQTFGQGLKLLDDFESWFKDVRNQVKDASDTLNLHPHVTTGVTSPTAHRIMHGSKDLFTTSENSDVRGFERLMFESLAFNARANLSADPETVFGVQNNPAMRFLARGMSRSQAPTIFQIPPEKRGAVFAVFDAIMPYKQKEETSFSYGMLMTNRILRNLDAIIAMHDRGTLTPANVFKLCFPDVAKLPQTFNENTVKQLFEDDLLARLMQEVPAGMGPIPVTMNTTGCTYDEAVQAYNEGTGVAPPKYAASFSVPVGDFDGTTRAAFDNVKIDFFRAMSYSLPDGSTHPANAHFSITFPGDDRFDAVNTNNDAERTRMTTIIHDKVLALCGSAHRRQASSVMFGLTQGALTDLRFGFPKFNVGSSEHSAVDYSLSKDTDTGAITIHYNSPSGCPITFSWTATVDTNGTITTTPIQITDQPTP